MKSPSVNLWVLFLLYVTHSDDGKIRDKVTNDGMDMLNSLIAQANIPGLGKELITYVSHYLRKTTITFRPTSWTGTPF
jgi:hypothetical protein